MNNELLIAAFGGGTVFAAIIESVRAFLGWRMKRKAQKEDRAEARADKKIDEQLAAIIEHQKEQDERMEKFEKTLALQQETNMFILYDRLRYLAKCYIADGGISFEDREAWNEMYGCYQRNGGNGNLKPLESCINSLPIKKG